MELPPLAPWPLPIVLFAALILLPGFFLASAVLAGRRVEGALLTLLSVVLGLVAVSGTAYLWVAISGRHLSLLALLTPSVSYTLVAGVLWWRGKRPQLLPTPLPLWLGLGVVAIAVFFTHDASVLAEAADNWFNDGRGNCFRLGTFQYLGLPSPVWQETLPPLAHYWDGIMPGNLALSSLYTMLFGAPGFRLLRMTMAILLGLQGYILGRRYSNRPLGGYVGLVVFALNPFVLMVQDTDRNFMALVFGAMLYTLLVFEVAGPILLGLLAGFTAGLGLQMLPLLFLLPVGWHVWQRQRRPLPAAISVICGLAVAALWLLQTGWYDPGPLNPLRSYDLGFMELRIQYVLGFPFYPEFTHGPFNTYPALLTFAFYVANTIGVALVGMGVLGWYRMGEVRRRDLVTLMLFGLPPILALGLMVRIVPDQLRLAMTCVLPCLVGITVGLNWALARRPTPLRIGLMAGAVVLPFVILLLLMQVRVETDPRFATPLPPTGADPMAQYMTPEARSRLGMTPGTAPPAGVPSVVVEASRRDSPRLGALSWPMVLPDYVNRHPIDRKDDNRWWDLK